MRISVRYTHKPLHPTPFVYILYLYEVKMNMKKVNHSIYLFLIGVTLLWILTRLRACW